jgi:two-component system phosphate regulon sensor histidine kinase PhoR
MMAVPRGCKTEVALLGALAAGVLCLSVAFYLPQANLGFRRWDVAGLILLGGAGLGAIWLSRRRRDRSLDVLGRQIQLLLEQDQLGEILVDWAGELDTLSQPVAKHLHALRRKLSGLQQVNGKLAIRGQVLEAQQQQLHAILRSTLDPVLVTNRFGELIFANEAAERQLGINLDVDRRRNIEKLLPDGALVRLIQETARAGHTQTRQVLEHVTQTDHAPQTFSIQLRNLPGANGSGDGVVAVLHNITREKEMERSRTEFVSNISHELKTPLASIKAYVEMLQDGDLGESGDVQEFYKIIARESDRLAGMVERILNISRIESGSVRVAREPVSMTAVVKQVLSVVAPQARAKDLKVREFLAPVYYQVRADYELLCQAVTNLLTNAIKYTPAGGEITIRVTAEQRRGVAAVEVSDTGMGIPGEELPKIFEKFYRVEAGMKMAPGSGLGLPLAKFIIEQIHEGTLSVTSEPGKGSTFGFELPLVV